MPFAELLELPDGYGRPKRALEWAIVVAALEQAKQYWLATVRPDGQPHVVPVDGIWLDDRWFYGGSPATLHRRNVVANPHAVMHLADPSRAVMVDGNVTLVEVSPDLATRLADASQRKYPEYGDSGIGSYPALQCLTPTRVIAWTSYPTDATRFRFA